MPSMKSPIEMIRIESITDPRVEDYRDIRDRDLIGPDGRRGLFIGETVLVVEVMLGIPGMTRSVLASEQQADRLAEMIAVSASPDTPLHVASRESIESIAGFDIHRGVIACGHRPMCSTRSLSNIIPPLGREATVLICEKINNIDNIGMLFRNAAAFGVDGGRPEPGLPRSALSKEPAYFDRARPADSIPPFHRMDGHP